MPKLYEKINFNIIFDSMINQINSPKVVIVNRGLIHNNNKFLLLKRCIKSSHPNTWEMPGGKLDPGETLEQNLLREIDEETGLKPHLVKSGINITNEFSDLEKYKGILIVTVVSLLQTNESEISLSEEHEDFGWFDAHEVHKVPNLRKNSVDMLKKLSTDDYLMALVRDFNTESLPNR